MKKQWNHIIHDRLKDFPKKAPAGLLDGIKAEMLHRGLKAVPVASKHQPVYRTAISRIAAIAAILLLLFGLGYQWTEQTDTSVILPPIAETGQPVIKVPVEHPILTATHSQTAAVAPQQLKRQQNVITHDSLHTTTGKAQPQKEQPTEKKQQKENPASTQTTDTYPNHLLATSSKRKDSSLSAGVYYSGAIAHKNNPEIMLAADKKPSTEEPLIPSDLKGKERYHLPIRFGLSVRYHINDHWSIQSGLTYSYLASDVSKRYKQASSLTKQKLHYIGIPLQAGFHFWTGNRFKGYVTAGGQMEKLLSGKATTDYSIDNELQSTATEKIHDKKLLFSTTASIGVEYNLSKHFSLYAEPGIQYYFKNGNGLKTIYNKHPLYFSITAGVRFQWKK